MKNVLLRFEDVSYSIGSKKILSEINWTVKKGDREIAVGMAEKLREGSRKDPQRMFAMMNGNA